MPSLARNLTAAAAIISLCSVSTVALASTPAGPGIGRPAPVASGPSSQWITLSAMTTGSSAASTATDDQVETNIGFPPVAPLVVILATIATTVYLLLRDDHHHFDFELPVSPS